MLKRTCQEFRDRFDPQGEPADQHYLQCPDCEAWVHESTRLETILSSAPPTPLPSSLTQRLQAIPQQVVLCRDVERLYAEVRRRAAASRHGERRGDSAGEEAGDSAAAEHLASCSRCQLLYGTLESVLLEPPQPLPQRLRPRLAKLAAEPSRKLPRWLQDARYAAAACFLLACSLTLVVEDATATFQEVRGSVQATTSSLAQTVRTTAEEAPRLVVRQGSFDGLWPRSCCRRPGAPTQAEWGSGEEVQRSIRQQEPDRSHQKRLDGRRIFDEVSASLGKNYLDSRQRISTLRSSWRTWTHETLRELETQRQRLSQKYKIQKGEHDG